VRRRFIVATLVAVLASSVSSIAGGPFSGVPPAGASVPVTEPPVDEQPSEQGTSTGQTDGGVADTVPTASTIPAECDVPQPVVATFVGTLVAADPRTGRFQIEQVRGGSLDSWAAGSLVDVDYGSDVRFLELEGRYSVGAGVDDASGRLESKVRDPEPLFGGNQVIGIGERDTDCPEFEDAVRTLDMDGRSVESGVLAPMRDSSDRVNRALLLPFLWVFGGLLGLAIIANIVRFGGRRLRDAWNGESVSRRSAPPRRGF